MEVQGYKTKKIIQDGPSHILYLGLRKIDQQEVVLKTLHASHPTLKDIAILKHEYRVLQKLSTLPGVVKCYDFVQALKPVLILEVLSEISLDARLQKGPLALKDALKIAISLTETLSAIHSKEVMHKDLKPSNIVIEPKTLLVKLIDFGLSSFFREEHKDNMALNDIGGTLDYVSPELTGRLNRVIDYRTDFYSLGITLYKMLSGQLPFQGKEPIEIIYAHLAKTPKPVCEVNAAIPKIISDIIDKLLAKDPEDRYQSAQGIKADLEYCYKQLSMQQALPAFPLGRYESHEHLQLSKKLYGRNAQIQTLLKAFKQISQNQVTLLLVSGYSGIGKTSLIKELYKPITQRRGLFVSAKFDQIQQAEPYYAFTEVLKKVVEHNLTKSAEKIELIRQRVLKAVGENGQVITNILPSLVNLIGEQPPVPELEARENTYRFFSTFEAFLKALILPEQPLILFVDDWQWADSGSLLLLQHIMSAKTLGNLLIISCYRDNEVTIDHPFWSTLQAIKKVSATVTEITLTPLKQEDIASWIIDSFKRNQKEVGPLAHLIHEKTEGNPFFVNEFLKQIYQDKLLRFDYEKNQWYWDLNKIKQQAYTQNVFDILTTRIINLPQQIQNTLKVGACIGYEFEAHIIAALLNLSLQETVNTLIEAANERFVSPLDDHYLYAESISNQMLPSPETIIRFQFTHDRPHKAAYLLTNKERASIHLQLGRFFLSQANEVKRYSALEIMNQFNQASHLVTESKERLYLAKLSLQASEKALSSNAYSMSVNYLEHGITYLPLDAWQTEQSLTYELHQKLVQSHFLNGDYEKADQLSALILSKSISSNQRADILVSNAKRYILKCDYVEALQEGLQALNLLNIPLPKQPNSYHIMKEMLIVKWLLRKKSFNKLLHMPFVKDKQQLRILNALDSIFMASIYTIPSLTVIITLKIMQITLKHGNSEEAVLAYIAYGLALLGGQRFSCPKKVEDEAYLFGTLGIQLSQQYKTRKNKAMSYFFYGFCLEYRRNPIRNSARYLREGYLIAKETGDMEAAALCVMEHSSALFFAGEHLANVFQELEKGLIITKKSNNRDAYYLINITRNFNLALQDNLPNHDWGWDGKCEHELVQIIINGMQFIRAHVNYFFWKLYYLYLMRHYKDAIEARKNYKEAIQAIEALSHLGRIVRSMYLWIIYYFISPLVLSFHYENLSKEEQKKALKKIRYFLNILKHRAATDPKNHANKYFLVKAEYARLMNQTQQAIDYYQQAIEAAKAQGFMHEEAMAHELLGNYYLKLHDQDAAQTHLQIAHTIFDVWGAKAKTKQMKSVYPFLMNAATVRHDSQHSSGLTAQLDMNSILKASQAISSEIQLSQLLKTVLYTLIENAGAQRGILLLCQKNVWTVTAEVNYQNEYLDQEEPLLERNDLPVGLIGYVEKTKELLVIDEALTNEHTVHEPYVKQAAVKSMLIIPIVYKGCVNTLLYLENNSVTCAFNQERVDLLTILAKQAAVSLENARLYHDATHDLLTGLANRSLLYQMFEYCAARAMREERLIAIIFLDLDYFKTINDTLGHEVGDKLLIYFAELIKKCLRKDSLAVRLGGDEFVIMLDGIKERSEVEALVKRLYSNFKKPIKLLGHTLTISNSMGISFYPLDAKDIHNLLRLADIALYKAKELGKNNYQYFMSDFLKIR